MKKILWNLYFIVACLIVVIGSLVQDSSLFLSLSSLCGVIYSLLVARNVKWALLFGIVNVSTYGYILFIEHIYGGFIYNVLYSLPMLTYGFYNWNKASKKADEGIKSVSAKTKIIAIFLIVAAVYMYSLILSYFGSENVLLDSVTSVLGYLGIYLLSNKYIEQWNVWIVSNLANVILWIILSIENIYNMPLALMWIIYFINSFYGYISWHKKFEVINKKILR